MKRLFTLFTCAAAGIVLLSGCGGGGGGSSRAGTLILTVKWPQNSRLIPFASNSIVATLLQGTGPTQLGSNTLPKPTGGATSTNVAFNNLEPGSVTLSAVAHPNANGSGTAQASGSVPATIVSGQTTNVTVTMATTIDHLLITPANPSVAAGSTLQLTMTAYNAQNEVVLTSAQTVNWSSATPSKATISGSGNVTGVAAGSSQITVTETESGKTANTTVTVTSGGGNNVGSIGPTGVTYGPDGKLYLTDSFLYRLIRLDGISGANAATFTGIAGSPFINPSQIAFDSQNRIYVIDTNNARVVRIDDFTGTNWTTYGAPGLGAGQFNGPTGVALDAQNRIYIADLNNSRIVRIDNMAGANWTTFGTDGFGVGQFKAPHQVVVDKQTGKIYIADSGSGAGRIARIDDMAGTNWVTYSNAQLNRPAGITLDSNGRIYVTDTGSFIIARFDDMTGANYVKYGSFGTGVGQFADPEGIAVDPVGHVYIADAGSFGMPGRLVRIDNMTGAGWTTFP
jgi:DNA-binding beta-propeller fold protein YncE